MQQPGLVPIPTPLQEPVYDICMQPYGQGPPHVKPGYDIALPYVENQMSCGEPCKTYETRGTNIAHINDYTHMWTTGPTSTAP